MRRAVTAFRNRAEAAGRFQVQGGAPGPILRSVKARRDALMFNEFKKFAMRGNVVDLAVGFILGGAFSTIVKSFVDDILMPPLGLLLGGVDFTNLYVSLDGVRYDSLAAAQEAGAATLNYGLFINAIISFLLLAFALFLLIKGMNRMTDKKKDDTPEQPPAKPRNEELLEEIRDLLKARN
jgi:large conductance mechanosensitive channel